MNKLKLGMAYKVGYVVRASSYKVVNSDNFNPFFEKPIAKMRAYKARTTSYQNTHWGIILLS